jgi:hypothetical protein
MNMMPLRGLLFGVRLNARLGFIYGETNCPPSGEKATRNATTLSTTVPQNAERNERLLDLCLSNC